jgi:hypothetical protein
MDRAIWLFILEYALSQAQLRYVSNFQCLNVSRINERKLALYKLNADPNFCIYVGYECQSASDSFEAYVWRDESIYLLSDMVLYISCDRMLPFANQLLEQGMYCRVWTPNTMLFVMFLI